MRKTTKFNHLERNILGIYAQTEWDYDRMVYLTLAARKDWVSNLAPQNASIAYPSAAVSVIPTKFIDGLKSNAINILKLRASYGTSANFPFGYPIASNLSFDTQDFIDSSGGFVITNTSGSQLGNTDLKPERMDEVELGLEGRFFDYRLSVDFSVYNRATLDLIVTQPLDPTTGYTNTATNIGKIENKGVEIDLNGEILRSQEGLNWNMGINWSTNESTVIDVGDTDRVVFAGFTNSVGNAATPGESLGAIYGSSIARDDQGRFLVNASGSYVEDTSLVLLVMRTKIGC